MSNYLLFAIIPLLFGMWAQSKVKSAYKEYSSIRTKTGITGAEAARKMLDSHGLKSVRIEKISGDLTDHYDPAERVLRLSEGVYDAPSIAAVGVACHEAGHAFQHSEKYSPLTLRTIAVPSVKLGSLVGPILFALGLLMSSFTGGDFGFQVSMFGLILYSAVFLFSAITLPVEYNASSRAKAWIYDSGTLYNDEQEGVKKVLDAAALTYVAAAIQSLATILYYASMLTGRSRDD